MIRRLPLSKYVDTAKYIFDNYLSNNKNPFYASFKVTSKCKFNCEFCDMKYYKGEDLPTEDVKKILRNLGESSVFLVSLEGGDPLLREDILEILKEARKQPFYLLFTTSERCVVDYPWEVYQDYIDFLHISIDEGHKNLELFKDLKFFNKYKMNVCVQTVVTKDTIYEMEKKVKLCYKSNSKILFMPAVVLDKMEDKFPDLLEFENEVKRLKKIYKGVIITPNSYFEQIKKKKGGCSANSIIIDSDGSLFYPCRTLKEKTIKLQDDELMKYINSKNGYKRRDVMKKCEKQCGWYQYFATSRFTSIGDFIDAAYPYLKDIL